MNCFNFWIIFILIIEYITSVKESSKFVEALFFDEEMDWRMDHVVDDWSDSEDTSQNTHHIDEQTMPFIMRDNV